MEEFPEKKEEVPPAPPPPEPVPEPTPEPPKPEAPPLSLEERVANLEANLGGVAQQIANKLTQLAIILGLDIKELPDGQVRVNIVTNNQNPNQSGLLARLFLQVNTLKKKLDDEPRIVTPRPIIRPVN